TSLVALQLVTVNTFAVGGGFSGSVKETDLEVAAFWVALKLHMRGAFATGGVKAAHVHKACPRGVSGIRTGMTIINHAPVHLAVSITADRLKHIAPVKQKLDGSALRRALNVRLS